MWLDTILDVSMRIFLDEIDIFKICIYLFGAASALGMCVAMRRLSGCGSVALWHVGS